MVKNQAWNLGIKKPLKSARYYLINTNILDVRQLGLDCNLT